MWVSAHPHTRAGYHTATARTRFLNHDPHLCPAPTPLVTPPSSLPPHLPTTVECLVMMGLLSWARAHNLSPPTPPRRQSCGLPYARAAHNGDMGTCATLRRLGCPWAPGGATFRAAVYDGRGHCGALPALQWLRREGCPVDWGTALAAADDAGEDACPHVRRWLEAARRRGAA